MRFLLRKLGPWAWALMAIEAGLTTRRHFRQTSPEDRARLAELLKRSGGRPGKLTTAERRELLRTAGRLRPGRLARDLTTNVIRPGRSARRSGRG